jgi:ABC-type dipeptide/oligopeptide/nickel transport system ATPase subunit
LRIHKDRQLHDRFETVIGDAQDRHGRLPASPLSRFPVVMRGWDCSRLALHPKFIVADEPVSALDVSINLRY